ncbi:hypothetical protein LCGC14_1270660 [marine sediment metagenome]|uniref:Uncharacterized protein n=1 Tax=marine sediment metagenome TaxID=412755 RepID=A0A0F9P197_9ZZZZ
MSERDSKTNTLLIEILIGIIAEIIVVILFFVNIFIPIIIGIIIFILLILRVKKNEIFIINRIIIILKKYEKIKNNNQKEKKKVRKFGTLLDNGREKLEKLGFNIQHNGDTIKNNFFGIHLTRRTKFIYQFLIRRLDKSQTKRPDEAYFSEGYPESQKESSITQVLYDFIEYLKNKRKFSKIYNFLRIKKKE